MTTLAASETGYCFRMSPERAAALRAAAGHRKLTVPALLELKVFNKMAPRQRDGVYAVRRHQKAVARPAFIIPMSQAQLDGLHAEASHRGLSIQALLELKVFGEIAPRQRKRRDASPQDQQALGFDLGATTERKDDAA